MIRLSKRSPFSNKMRWLDLDIKQTDLDRYHAGFSLIQEVFPTLSADEREFIKSGIYPGEWEEYLGNE